MNIVDAQTHKPLKSIKFTKPGFWFTLVYVFLMLCIAIFCLVAYTPIRTLIPGYPDAHSKREAISNAIKIDSLENVMDGMRRFGLLMYASEGEIIAHTMPAYIAEAFDKYLTPSERDMIRLTEIEVETPSVTDEGVIVTNEELAHRLKLCDDMLAAYPNDQMTAEIKACQEHYLICLLLNADNQQDSALQQTIEAYVESYPDAASTPLLQQFLEIADQPNADHKKFIEQNILNN